MMRARDTPPPPAPLSRRLWTYLQPATRFWGLLTVVVLSGAGAELTALGSRVEGVAVLVGAVLVLILETLWVGALFVDVLGRRGRYGRGLRAWDCARDAARRARPPLYACAATALLLSHATPFATAAGVVLMVQAVLRAAPPLSPLAPRSGPPAARAGRLLLSDTDLMDDNDDDDDNRCEELAVLDNSLLRP